MNIKTLFIFGVSLFFISCSLFSQDNYKVEKIDSIDNYYLIYLSNTNEKDKYKIVSEKQNNSNYTIIKEGGIYKFTINSFSSRNDITYVSVSQKNYILGIQRKNGKIIKFGTPIKSEKEWGGDLFYAKEILGLCYLK